MVAAGHVGMADEHRRAWNLDPSVLQLTPEALQADAAARADAYLQLPAHVTIHVVDSVAGLAAVAGLLENDDVLGLDAEWRPATVSDSPSPPSLLQVASMNDVCLLDLLTLTSAVDAAPALQSCLDKVLRRPLVLGFDVAEDLRKLAAAWPTVDALRDVPRLLDLQQCADVAGMVRACVSTGYLMCVPNAPSLTKQSQGTQRKGSNVSLSRLAEQVLGKPLDKAARMSDWNARPLSAAQQRYAALDAWSLVSVYETLARGEGNLAQLQARVRSHRPADQRCGGSCGRVVDTVRSGRALPQCSAWASGWWLCGRRSAPRWRGGWRPSPGIFVHALRLAAL